MRRKFLRKFAAGEYIFHEGDPGDCAYIIESGRVQVRMRKDGRDEVIANFGAGDIIGEMAIIDGLPRSATVIAVEDTEMSTVSRKLLNDRIEASDPIVRLLISLLLKRIRNSNRASTVTELPTEPTGSTFLETLNSSEARDRLRMENELLRALEKREFFLEYQDILSLNSREVSGFEALLRWQSADRGLVRPDQFINIAEQTSVIVPLGYWIIEQAFIDLNRLAALGNPDLFMSINVSIRQLVDPHFAQRITNLHRKYNVDPKNIKLEVTERVFHEDPMILQTVTRVRAAGYQISLDDFGTGYSSLTALFNLQVDNIKIDRSFVATLLQDPKSRAIVQAVIAMGIELGLSVVAEGIEADDQAVFLAAMGCQLGQGFYFARPQRIETVLQRLSANKTAAA